LWLLLFQDTFRSSTWCSRASRIDFLNFLYCTHLLFYSTCLVSIERERWGFGLVGRWGRSGRTWERGTLIRIHCMKNTYFRLKNAKRLHNSLEVSISCPSPYLNLLTQEPSFTHYPGPSCPFLLLSIWSPAHLAPFRANNRFSAATAVHVQRLYISSVNETRARWRNLATRMLWPHSLILRARSSY